MIRFSTLALCSALLIHTADAQERCTAHTLTQRWLQEQGRSTDLAEAIRAMPRGERKGGGTPTVPVVVHVVWNTASENVPDAVIQDMLVTLNEDFQALNSDHDEVRSTFLDDRGNPDIAFCLAQVDPNGDATTGITRTQTAQTWFDPDNETNDMKSAPDGMAPWDTESYLNIWICDISSGATGGLVTAGYAYLPLGGVVGSDIDGLVLDYDYGVGPGARTATHEIGHYFGLDHPWGDGGCDSDDGMDDTPVTDEPTFSCANTNLMNCSVLTMYENFMDYADCQVMFTNDQAAYMNTVLNGVRSGLLNNNACGTTTTGPCIPTSQFGTSDGDFVDGVELGTINNTNSGSTSSASYQDHTDLSTNLQQGSSYTITITSGDYAPDHFAAWIDYDQNDVFSVGEKLGEFTNTTGGEAQDISFTVPAGATPGTTVMRVRGVFVNTGDPDPVIPCHAYDYGETEDYSVVITSNGGSGPCIPTSAVGTADGDFVDGVQLEDINNTGTGGVTGPTYHDYTAQGTDLVRGQSYTLTVTSGSYESDIVGAWIDFNANNVFEPDELLGEFLTTTTFEDVEIDFTVPTDATLGQTRLRARVMYPDTDNGEPTNADPCVNFSWGETEDYSVTIGTNTGLVGASPGVLMAYPIPADEALQVRMPTSGSWSVEMIDALGRPVLARTERSATWEVDTRMLANGHYVLRCMLDGQLSILSFSVQHGQ